MTWGSVESSTTGTLDWVAKRDATSSMSSGAVATHVVDAHVEHVGALLHLVLGHGHGGVPVGVQQRLAELLGAVGVGALADDQERGVLVERHHRVDRGGPGLVHRLARRRLEPAAGVDHGLEVRRGGAAAATDHVDAELDHEAAQVLGQPLGGQVVVHVPVDHRRQPGVGDAGDGHAGVLGQVAQVLAHLDRAGGAVDADEVGPHGVERAQGGGDLGAGQHAPGQLDGHLHLQRDLRGRRPPWPGGHRSWPP